MAVKTSESNGENAAAQAVRDAARIKRIGAETNFEIDLSIALMDLPADKRDEFTASMVRLGQATRLLRGIESGQGSEELEVAAQLKKARSSLLEKMRSISEDGHAAVCDLLKESGQDIGASGKQ